MTLGFYYAQNTKSKVVIMDLGIFIRGRLIGVKNDKNTSKKTGEVFNYTALGIDLPFTNSFGVKSTITKEIRISKQKLNDAAFMKSLQEHHNKLVEIEIGIGDFKNLFVSSTAVITVLNDNKLQAAS